MLEKLDLIDWKNLRHAYGNAEDVPDLIRTLISPSLEVRNQAMFDLHGNVWHQGTIYQVTPHVVPFLIELAASPETPDRHDILSYIGTLAAGNSYIAVHKDVLDFSEDELGPKLEQELRWVSETREEVKKGEALYLNEIASAQHEMCTAAAYVLSRFPEERAYWKKLCDRYAASASEDVPTRCGIAMLTQHFAVHRMAVEDTLREMFKLEASSSVRIPLAASLALSSAASNEILFFLADNILGDDSIDQLYRLQPWDSGEVVWDVISALCASDQGRAIAESKLGELRKRGGEPERLRYADCVSVAP